MSWIIIWMSPEFVAVYTVSVCRGKSAAPSRHETVMNIKGGGACGQRCDLFVASEVMESRSVLTCRDSAVSGVMVKPVDVLLALWTKIKRT